MVKTFSGTKLSTKTLSFGEQNFTNVQDKKNKKKQKNKQLFSLPLIQSPLTMLKNWRVEQKLVRSTSLMRFFHFWTGFRYLIYLVVRRGIASEKQSLCQDYAGHLMVSTSFSSKFLYPESRNNLENDHGEQRLFFL